MNRGKCAGGPINGRVVEFDTDQFIIPLAPTAKVNGDPSHRWGGFSSGLYVWHDVVQMWIWRG